MSKGIRKILNIVSTLFLSLTSKRNSSADLVIIKTDAIGDMFIFFNALKKMNIEIVDDQKVLIICQKMNAVLVKHFFPSFEVISISNDFYFSNDFHNDSSIKAIFNLKAKKLINLMPSRDTFSDLISFAIKADQKSGFKGDLSKQGRVARFLGTYVYDNLLGNYSVSEFDLIHDTLKNFSGMNPSEKISKNSSDHRNGIVIFPGSSWVPKNWPIQNFIELIEFLLTNYNERISICGGQTDLDLGKKLTEHFGDKIKNLMGKTSLIELSELLKTSVLLISNDTSAAHIARYHKTPSVVFIGGGHGDRFLPYNCNDFDFNSVILRHKMDCYFCNWNCHLPKEMGAVPCVSRIDIKEVQNSIRSLI